MSGYRVIEEKRLSLLPVKGYSTRHSVVTLLSRQGDLEWDEPLRNIIHSQGRIASRRSRLGHLKYERSWVLPVLASRTGQNVLDAMVVAGSQA